MSEDNPGPSVSQDKNNDKEMICRNKVLQHILDIANELNMPMYYNTNTGSIVSDSYVSAFARIDSVQKLEEIYDRQDYADIYLKSPFSSRLIVACLKEDEAVRQWFFNHSDNFLGFIKGTEFNEILEENRNNPQLIADLVSVSGWKLGPVERHSFMKTFDILMSALPEPENKNAMVLYLFRQKEELLDNITSLNDSGTIHAHRIASELNRYFDHELQEFYFLDFVKKHHQSQTVVLTNDEIDNTLRLQLNFENISRYLALSFIDTQSLKSWMNSQVLPAMERTFHANPEYFAFHSCEHAVQNDKSVNLYYNVKKGSCLTREALAQSITSLLKDIKKRNITDRAEFFDCLGDYVNKYWLKEKITHALDKSENHAVSSEEQNNENYSRTRNKI
jgi:hypothetical protein